MNNYHRGACLVLSLLLLPLTAMASDALHQQALGLVKQFGATLKPQLKQAIQQGGPQTAVEVCANKAPKIAAQLAAQSGWDIRRVSLKNRSELAIADEWEQGVLRQFELQVAAGKPAKELEYAATVAGEYRFMKAQLITPLCLQCHGTNVAAAVQEKINQHYPYDSALGYRLGEVRGAFSLTFSPEPPIQ